MAAPLAHIFLAAKMLTGPLKGFFDEKEFIIGTSFPDIRYLKVIERSKTHANHVSLEIIMQEKDSFKAGILFHSFVDEQREHYITMHKLYEKLPCFKFTPQALKFAEDALLRINWDCTHYIKYFDAILEQEKSFDISTEHIKLWHSKYKNICKIIVRQKNLC